MGLVSWHGELGGPVQVLSGVDITPSTCVAVIGGDWLPLGAVAAGVMPGTMASHASEVAVVAP